MAGAACQYVFMRRTVSSILLVAVGAVVLGLGALGALLSRGVVGPAEWSVTSQSVVVEDCSVFTVPSVDINVALPALIDFVVRSADVRVEVLGASQWGIVEESRVPDALLGRQYCAVSGPPWSITRINAGNDPKEISFAWGSGNDDDSLQLPDVPTWIVGESEGKSVSIRWAVTYQWREDLLSVSLVAITVGMLGVIAGAALLARSRHRSKVPPHE